MNQGNINYRQITAVIPVRSGSTRCKHKNIRNFGDTNLLKLKIETLKKVKSIDKILVSSNCDIMLNIAKDMGVDNHKRDEEYCTSNCSGSKFMVNLAEQVSTEYFLYSTCVTPLASYHLVEQCIDQLYMLQNYDSVVLANFSKNFIWDINKPINYDLDNAPPSQELPEYYIPNFACCLIQTDKVIKYKNVIGKKPYFIETDVVSGLDVDESSDFITAELLYNNHITNKNVCNMILDKRKDNISLLDCTIRDGGYLNNWEFTDEEVLNCYQAVTGAGYEYFEIGFRTNKKILENKGKWCYSNEEDINNICKEYKGCKIAVMAKVGTMTINDFIKKDQSNITMVRVLLARCTLDNGIKKSYYNISDIIKAKKLCQQLIDYGYEVCMNFSCGDIINDDEIKIIASQFHNVKIKALYLADTYGGFNTINLPIQLHKFYSEFNKFGSNISFGFHSHNNNENALDKTKTAIFHGCTMIDSCIGGLGRGAGNLKSEQFISYLYTNKAEYIQNFSQLIVFYDKYMLSKKEYCENKYIKSHPYYMIAGVLSLHPDYINEILPMNTSVLNDIELIVKLDKYTRENDCRNYDKNLIKTLKAQW